MNNELRIYDPAHALGRHPTRTTERYTFVPTEQVISSLGDAGWKPSKVIYTKPRKEDRQGYQKHMIRFRRSDDDNQIKVGDSIAELLMINSHDATTSYRFFGGVFRLVCSNGMVVSETDFGGIRVPHKGDLQEIVQSSLNVAAQLPTLAAIVDSMKRKVLTEIQRMDFAAQAAQIRHGKDTLVEPATFLQSRRNEDSGKDLWTTMNVVQENIMKGGGVGQLKNGNITNLRPVKGMDMNLSFNQGIWELAAGMVR